MTRSSAQNRGEDAGEGNRPGGFKAFAMKRAEPIAVAVLFMALLFPLAFVKSGKFVEQQGDSAFLCELTENIAFHGLPTTAISTTVLDFIARGVSLDPKNALTANLAPSPGPFNQFSFHPYYILVLLAPFVWMFPAHVVLSVLTTISFLALIFLVYLHMRSRSAPAWAAVLFCCLLTYHPAWTQGLVLGQLYADRLFLLLGALFLFSFVKDKPNRVLTCILAGLSALIVERVGLILGGFVIAHTALFWKRRKDQRIFALWLGAALFAYSWILIHFAVRNPYYSTFMPANLHDLLNRLETPAFMENLKRFLVVNFGMLGLFAIFNPRALLLALLVMVPNIIGTIGGAEKTGWSTHYHTLYLPFLFWAAADGMVFLVRFDRPFKRVGLALAVAMTVAATAVFGGIEPGSFDLRKEWKPPNLIANNGCLSMLRALPVYWNKERRDALHFVSNRLQALVPENSSFSGPESVFPSLYRKRTLYYFPIGMDKADYAMPIAMSYLGPEKQAELKSNLLERMRRDGYDMAHPASVAPGIEIYRRIFPPQSADAASTATQPVAPLPR